MTVEGGESGFSRLPWYFIPEALRKMYIWIAPNGFTRIPVCVVYKTILIILEEV